MLMDEILKSWAAKVPELGALCFIVMAFLKSQNGRDEFLRSLHNEHLAARGESREAIKENTDSNREVSHAIHALKETLLNQRQ